MQRNAGEAVFRRRRQHRLAIGLSAVAAAVVVAIGAQLLVVRRMEKASFSELEHLWWTATLLLVVPLVGSVAVAVLSRRVGRALVRITEGASALASGRLDKRIEVGPTGELGALAAELNGIAVVLDDHRRRLDESERFAAIGRAVARVADEINNPLQVMLGYLSLNRDHGDRHLAAQLAMVERETLRCKQIVEALLELTCPAGAGVRPAAEAAQAERGAAGRSGATALAAMSPAPAPGGRRARRRLRRPYVK
jgi:signal transduction histidine kinase